MSTARNESIRRLTLDEWEAIAATIAQADQARVNDQLIAVGSDPVDLGALYQKVTDQ